MALTPSFTASIVSGLLYQWTRAFELCIPGGLRAAACSHDRCDAGRGAAHSLSCPASGEAETLRRVPTTNRAASMPAKPRAGEHQGDAVAVGGLDHLALAPPAPRP